ncbi:MAG: hypothetical protein GX173_07670 [Ruminococcaceae bacterium]|nr:hypothetical protein [Oscillospiraceae bacterium]
MKALRIRELSGFYENELTNNLLPFWVPGSLDLEHGGYFNCFDNSGRQLLSRHKYTWSQGRFVWLFARLAMMESNTFTARQKQEFLRLAKSGRDFLHRHVLVGPDDWRCTFLMDESGRPMPADDSGILDLSIYADCFVTIAFARYALAAGDASSYLYAKKLFNSILDRISSGQYRTHPYPLNQAYRAHGIPMILCHVTRELYLAACRFAPADSPELAEKLEAFCLDILDHFVDDHEVVHEVVGVDNSWLPNMLGQHANPGHTLECMWFLGEAAETLGQPLITRRALAIVRRTCQIGWDDEMGGLLHYCHVRGGPPRGRTEDVAEEPMLRQVQAGWSDKLWWVHSEALYTTMLCHVQSGDTDFQELYDRLADYTFRVFPNPDREIREWIQIRKRDGSPQEKVVALPVKDPYHIIRNVVQLIELLNRLKTG